MKKIASNTFEKISLGAGVLLNRFTTVGEIVDADIDAVVKPVRGPIMDILYKIVNFFANLFYKFS